MLFTAQVLTREEMDRVHFRSLQILAESGVRIYCDRALKLLENRGAQVNWEQKVARIPSELVAEALHIAPHQFTLGARNSAFDYPMPSTGTRFCLDGTAAFATDFETGERRYGSRQDNISAFRILQKMDTAIMAWPPTCISESPASTRPLHEFFTMMEYSSRHGQHELHTVDQVPYLVDGLKAVLGSEENIRQGKQYSVIYCPVAPLSHDGPMLEAYLELGSLDVPVMVMPMPVAGTTGPASLFSTICLANAEFLSTLVVFELDHPGRPLIFSSATGTVDFRSGGFLGGTPEMALQSAALVQMGAYYDLPRTAAGCTSDAHQPGPEAVLEKIITTLPPILAGADIVVGLGEIEGDQNLVLEQIVVDNEIAHQCLRLAKGVDSQDAKDLYTEVVNVGPGGHFLASKNTRLAPRTGEFHISDLLPRHTHDSWVELGKPSMYDKARTKVREILAEPLADPLPENIAGELSEILRKADRKLAGTD
jgi:trimethylamine--corrinoid protein Co-methyltransferase